MTPFIDIHTHFRNSEVEQISVLNYTQNEDWGVSLRDEKYHSVGLHPWYLTKENFEKDFEKLTQNIGNQNFVALGECGLDRLRGADLDFQVMAFEAQIRLAEQFSKPVIIHCVRAYNDVISVKKRLKPHIPLVIHGFNQNQIILNELLKNGFYISIGANVLNLRSNAAQALNFILLSQLFF